MKSLLMALALFLAIPFATFAKTETSVVIVLGDGDGEDAVSSMNLKVSAVIGSDKDAKKIKQVLNKQKGVKSVNVCTKSGNVTIKYDKNQGNTENIGKSVSNAGYKYEMVKSCCSKDSGKKSCPSSSGNKECGGAKQ